MLDRQGSVYRNLTNSKTYLDIFLTHPVKSLSYLQEVDHGVRFSTYLKTTEARESKEDKRDQHRYREGGTIYFSVRGRAAEQGIIFRIPTPGQGIIFVKISSMIGLIFVSRDSEGSF